MQPPRTRRDRYLEPNRPQRALRDIPRVLQLTPRCDLATRDGALGRTRQDGKVITSIERTQVGYTETLGELKGTAAAEVHRAACSPQGKRGGYTGFIRAAPLSEDPQSPALRLIVRPEQSTQIL
jgi:hypothetical protein